MITVCPLVQSGEGTVLSYRKILLLSQFCENQSIGHMSQRALVSLYQQFSL